MRTSFLKVAAVTAAAALIAAACADSAITTPAPSTQLAASSASFGRNPGAGPAQRGGGGAGGGGGGGGVANCGQPLVTLAHGAQFSRGCSIQGGCLYFPINAAARALAPKGLDLNCNIIV